MYRKSLRFTKIWKFSQSLSHWIMNDVRPLRMFGLAAACDKRDKVKLFFICVSKSPFIITSRGKSMTCPLSIHVFLFTSWWNTRKQHVMSSQTSPTSALKTFRLLFIDLWIVWIISLGRPGLVTISNLAIQALSQKWKFYFSNLNLNIFVSLL